MASTASDPPVQLKVNVQKASRVYASDPNGKSDPYCIIHLGVADIYRKTEIRSSTLDPIWNESFTIPGKELAPLINISDGELQLYGYIVFDVWDHDTANPDDFLGRVMIPLSEIPSEDIKESWYPLTRRTNKDVTTGSLKIQFQLVMDENVKVQINHSKVNTQLYSLSTSHGFQLSLMSGRDIVEFPGRTETVEMAFSHVYVDVSSHHCTAQVYLTNYRLVIFSTSYLKSHHYRGKKSTIDLSMWIALNNIMSIDTGSETAVVRRPKSGQKRKTLTTSIIINCYDVRTVKLIFLVEEEDSRSRSKSPEILSSNSDFPRDTLALTPNFGQKLKDMAVGSPSIGRKIFRNVSEKIKAHTLPGNPLSRSQSEVMRKPQWFVDNGFGVKNNFTGRQRTGALLEEPSDVIINCDDDDRESNASYDMILDEEDDMEYCFDDYLDCSNERVPLHMDVEGDSGEGVEGEEGGGTSGNEINGHSQNLPPRATATLIQVLQLRLEHLITNIADYPPAQIFVKHSESQLQLTGWDLYSFPKEMDRQRVEEDKWQLSVINGPQYQLCDTYPQLMYIPRGTKDSTLHECAKFRSRNRLPCLVWVDSTRHNFMLRCAQPYSGKAGKRSAGDEQLIESALNAGPPDGHMIIFDARTFSAATGNKIMGKGTEVITGYPRAKLNYLAIPNIHAVRESYDSLKALCLSPISGKWFSSLENTHWLNYLSLILKGSVMITRYMKLQQGSVLVHCSDGWDRTSQLTSLSQIMMDSYYRTMDGFKVLVDKEWLSFGHKFQKRIGHTNYPNERSPIFLQFLDCVHQLVTQFPTSFEFNQSFLLCIADHLNTSWFGTFLCNCDKERHDLSLYARTPSLWAHLSAMSESFTNSSYVKTDNPIFPTSNIRRLRLWEEYFLRYDYTALIQWGGGSGVDHHTDTTDYLDTTIRPTNTLGHDSWSADTVLWMSDDRANECCYCQQKFSAFKRRHHCRACGRIFCNECSKHKIALTHLGYDTPVRVCDECHRNLNDAKTSDAEDGFLLISTKEELRTTI